MTRTRSRQMLLAVALVALAAALAVFIARRSASRAPDERDLGNGGFQPRTDAAAGSASAMTAPTETPMERTARDAGVSMMDLRLWRQKLDPELCPKAGEQINKLSGRAPTDPKAINLVSLCLQTGNVAWYKCLLSATTEAEGAACTTHFLQPAPP
jgi:hypothetical protein